MTEHPRPEQTGPEQTGPQQTGPEQTGPEQTGAVTAGSEASSPAAGLGWPPAPTPERTRFATPPAPTAGPEAVSPEPVVPERPAPEPVSPEPLEPVAPEPLGPVTPEPLAPEPGAPQPITPEPLLQEASPAAEAVPAAPSPKAPAATSSAEPAAASPAESAAASVPAYQVQEQQAEAGAPVGARGKGLVAVLAGLVLVLAALTGFLAWRAHDTEGLGPVAASRSSALDAARTSARLVFSYDYRHLAKDFKAGRAVTTGQFQGEYDKTTAKLVTDVAPRYKAVVVADVSDAGVVSASTNEVVALVFLNQQSSSSLVATPKITQSRLEMTLVRKDGRWLVSKIKAL